MTTQSQESLRVIRNWYLDVEFTLLTVFSKYNHAFISLGIAVCQTGFSEKLQVVRVKLLCIQIELHDCNLFYYSWWQASILVIGFYRDIETVHRANNLNQYLFKIFM